MKCRIFGKKVRVGKNKDGLIDLVKVWKKADIYQSAHPLFWIDCCICPEYIAEKIPEAYSLYDDDLRMGDGERFYDHPVLVQPEHVVLYIAWLCSSFGGDYLGSATFVFAGKIVTIPPAYWDNRATPIRWVPVILSGLKPDPNPPIQPFNATTIWEQLELPLENHPALWFTDGCDDNLSQREIEKIQVGCDEEDFLNYLSHISLDLTLVAAPALLPPNWYVKL